MNNMQAILFHGNSTAEFTEVEIPEISDSQALIRISYAGVCGSDIGIFKGTNKRAVYPIIPGHEFIGWVLNLPKGYKGFLQEGQRVMIIPTVSCGVCWGCKHSLRHICNDIKFLGIQFNGGFAQFATVPIANLLVLPDSLSLELGVLSEPIAVGIHAVSFVQNLRGKKILIFGGGPIGLITAMVARLEGAEVTIAEPMQERRQAAVDFGFCTINSIKDDPLEIKRTITNNEGFDVFFECAGHPSTFSYMINTTKQRGQVVVVSTFKEPPSLDIFMMSRKEMHIDISWTYLDSDCEKAISLLNANQNLFRPLITHTFLLSETEDALNKFINGGDTLKVSILVNEE